MKKLTAFIAVVALGLLTTLTASAQISLQKVTTTVSYTNSATSYFNFVYSTNNDPIFSPLADFDALAASDSVRWKGNTAWWPGATSPTHDPLVFDIKFTTTLNYLTNSGISDSLTANETFTVTAAYSDASHINLSAVLTSDNLPQTIHWNYDNNSYYFTLSAPFGSFNYGTLGANSGAPIAANLNVDLVVNPVPEPSTYALMGASGLAALVGFRRLRSKKASKA